MTAHGRTRPAWLDPAEASPRRRGAVAAGAATAAALALAMTGAGFLSPAASLGLSSGGRMPAVQQPAGSGTPSGGGPSAGAPGTMTMAQTLSDQAQLTTIAFDGLAFLTGGLGADSFFPPGKVADFWGFQYLRDNDPSGMGHNTDFLTKAALTMYSLLTTTQRAQLMTLAKGQVDAINQYGYDRFALMNAFRRALSGDLPTGSTGLSKAAVQAYSASLYQLDGQISLERARVMGGILAGLTPAQKASLDALVGTGMTTWPNVTEPDDMKPLSHDEKVAVMTYSGDLFAWYAGDVEADVYFCPERQGTYFGSFYLKDAPAVGNPGYSIGTNITGDMGNAFLAALTADQRALVTGLVESQRADLTEIVAVRGKVAAQLRRSIAGGAPDTATVTSLMRRYGELDGDIVYQYATAFVQVGKTLTDAQRTTLLALRKQTVGDFTPSAAFLYASSIPFPTVTGTDSLLGVGTATPTVIPAGGTASPSPTPTPTTTPQPVKASVTLTARPTTVAKGAPVTVTVVVANTAVGGTLTVRATPRGQAATAILTKAIPGAGTSTIAYRPQRTTVLTATFKPTSGVAVTSTAVTVAVR